MVTSQRNIGKLVSVFPAYNQTIGIVGGLVVEVQSCGNSKSHHGHCRCIKCNFILCHAKLQCCYTFRLLAFVFILSAIGGLYVLVGFLGLTTHMVTLKLRCSYLSPFIS